MRLLQHKTQMSNNATLSILRTKFMICRAWVGQSTEGRRLTIAKLQVEASVLIGAVCKRGARVDDNGNNVLSIQSEGWRPLIITKFYVILLRKRATWFSLSKISHHQANKNTKYKLLYKLHWLTVVEVSPTVNAKLGCFECRCLSWYDAV